MGRKMIRFINSFSAIYSGKNLPRASAALSYYLTMTFFPLIICLYTLLGNSYDKAMRVLSFTENLMAEETTEILEDFLLYVSQNNSLAMMIAGLIVLLTYSSAAVRTLQASLGEIQGGQKYLGARGYLFSLVFSMLFMAALYFAILVMLTGRTVIERINHILPFIDISQSWNYVRFLVMGGIMYVIIWGTYESVKRRWDRYSTWPGAMAASLAMVGVSIAYSMFIGASTRYPLVYGSLASVVLLMLWLYTCCLVIYCGAALNIVIRDQRYSKRRN